MTEPKKCIGCGSPDKADFSPYCAKCLERTRKAQSAAKYARRRH